MLRTVRGVVARARRRPLLTGGRTVLVGSARLRTSADGRKRRDARLDAVRPMEGPMATSCEHLKGMMASDFPPPRTPDACPECLVEGTPWVALRECRTCGHVGCCD